MKYLNSTYQLGVAVVLLTLTISSLSAATLIEVPSANPATYAPGFGPAGPQVGNFTTDASITCISNLSADGGFLTLLTAGSAATPNTNLNTDAVVSWQFDVTVEATSIVTVESVFLQYAAYTSVGDYHPANQNLDFIQLEVFDGLNVSQGLLSATTKNAGGPIDFQANYNNPQLNNVTLTGSSFDLNPGVYTIEISSQNLATSGMFFGTQYFSLEGSVAPIPEPTSAALLMGALGLLAYRRRR